MKVNGNKSSKIKMQSRFYSEETGDHYLEKKILEITTSVQLKRPEKERSRLYEIRRNPSKRKSVRQKNL